MAAVWIAGLIASGLPDLLGRLRTGDGAAPVWVRGIGMLAALALITAAYWRRWPHSVRLLAAVLAAQSAGYLLAGYLGQTPAYSSWAARVPGVVGFAAANAAKVVPAALVALVLVSQHVPRQSIFLQIGNLRARAGPPFEVGWPVVATVTVVVASGYLAIQLYLTRHPNWGLVNTLAPQMPVVLIGAAVNTFCEEFLFRNSLLGPLLPTMGPAQALWLTSLRFGIGHYYGNPSGPLGVLTSTFFGWLLGRSMLETRGSGWAWLIHWAEDILIFTAIALAPRATWLP